MGWTVNQSRRRDRLRHRPRLEHLDDRCLLSVGLTGSLIHDGSRASAIVHRAGHHDAARGKSELIFRHHGRVGTHREAPAGTTGAMSSAGAPYNSIIGASQVQSNYNVTGSGMTVAVIDTGVDYNNPSFGGGFGPGAKVIAGYDFADNSANPMATSSQHGTAVAGIIGSSNPADPGVAPGVNIVGLRVTDGSNTASLQSIANALQWVVDNHEKYNITVVNMSLSDGQNYAHNWFATSGGAAEQVTNLIGQLRNMNIPVVVATGNSFNGQQGEGFAAIVQGTISVTATDLSGHLLPDAQRLGSAMGGSSATVIAAPGAGYNAPSGDNGMVSVDGTSFATAMVSGSVVLLQQVYEQRFGALPTVDQLQSWIQGGADPISDAVTGITIGQLDLPKAAALIPGASSTSAPTPKPTPQPTPTPTPQPTPTPPPQPTPTPTPQPTPTPTPGSSVVSSLQVTTASTAPTPSPTSVATSPPASSPSPSSSPSNINPGSPPPSTPTPAPTTTPTQVLSNGGNSSNTAGSPLAASRLARLLESMRVWAASSASQG